MPIFNIGRHHMRVLQLTLGTKTTTHNILLSFAIGLDDKIDRKQYCMCGGRCTFVVLSIHVYVEKAIMVKWRSKRCFVSLMVDGLWMVLVSSHFESTPVS